MERLDALAQILGTAAVIADIEAAAAAHETRLAADVQLAALRHLIRDGLDLVWAREPLRSLWLQSQRGLSRARFRKYPGSLAVALAWRGEGLVLLRGPGERRSVALVPWSRPPGGGDSARHVAVPAGTLHDTLADAATWHLVVFHAAPAAELVRLEETQEGGFVEHPELASNHSSRETRES